MFTTDATDPNPCISLSHKRFSRQNSAQHSCQNQRLWRRAQSVFLPHIPRLDQVFQLLHSGLAASILSIRLPGDPAPPGYCHFPSSHSQTQTKGYPFLPAFVICPIACRYALKPSRPTQAFSSQGCNYTDLTLATTPSTGTRSTDGSIDGKTQWPC